MNSREFFFDIIFNRFVYWFRSFSNNHISVIEKSHKYFTFNAFLA